MKNDAIKQKSFLKVFCRETTVGIGRLFFAICLALFIEEQPVIGQTNESPSISPRPDFHSLFGGSLVVTNSVFEKEIFLAEIPAAARKQIYFLKIDGRDYVMGLLKDIESAQYDVIGGHFNETLWEVNPNFLMFDLQHNKPTNSNPVMADESTRRMTIRLFLNMGITEIVPATVVWLKEQNQLVAQSIEGKNIVVDFEGGIEAPTKASIKNDSGEEYSYVRYKYDPGFCDGKIPKEFTRFYSQAPSEDVGKIFTVRVKKIKFSQNHIALAELDPLTAFHFKNIFFYSNNVMFWKKEGSSSIPQQVLTAEEAYKNLPQNVAKADHNTVIRMFFVGLLILSTIGVVVALLGQKRVENKN